MNTTVTSLLTFLYNENEDSMEILLIDYSKIDEDKKIYLRDLVNDIVEEIPITDSENSELESVAEEMEENKNKVLIQAKETGELDGNDNASVLASNCSYWLCTSYESYGGDYSSKCMALAGTLCAGVGTVQKFGSVICHGLNLIGCYVPKYKICSAGYWENRYCLM